MKLKKRVKKLEKRLAAVEAQVNPEPTQPEPVQQ